MICSFDAQKMCDYLFFFFFRKIVLKARIVEPIRADILHSADFKNRGWI